MKRFLTGIAKEDIGEAKYNEITSAMKDYAELYAERCIAQLSLSLNIGIEIVKFKPISKYQIELPEHEP